MVHPDHDNKNSVIIPPCYIGKEVTIENSVVGPHVSIGEGSRISESVIRNSIVQTKTRIRGANIQNSMIGNKVDYQDSPKDLSIGDLNVINEG